MKVESDTLLLSSREMADLLQAACEKGVPFRFTARGMSMSPFICDGDAIMIEPVLKQGMQIGDIAAYICPETGSLTVHRIVAIKNNFCLLKGDNVFRKDGWIKKKDVHGSVNHIIAIKNKAGRMQAPVRWFFIFLNNYKKTVAVLSRYNLSTALCRIVSRII